MSKDSLSSQTSPKRKQAELGASLIRAVIAVLITVAILQAVHPVFVVAEKYNVGMGSSPEATAANAAQQVRVARLNSVVELAILSAMLATALALGKSDCCSTMTRLFTGIPWGGLVGAMGGFIGSWALTWRDQSTLPTVSDTAQVQALVFSWLGLGLGLLAGLFSGLGRQAVIPAIGGTIAGIVAGVIYPVGAAVLMPTVSVEAVVPVGVAIRLLWSGLFVACFTLITRLMISAQSVVSGPDFPRST